MNLSRTLIISLLVPAIWLLSGCKEEGEGTFILKLQAKYGDQDFALNTPNTDEQGRRIKVETLKFYLSHLTLVKEDNSEVELKDVALVDLSDPSSLQISGAVEGSFKAIKFNTGVDSIQNLTDPTSVSASHPLSASNDMHWEWLKYVFYSLEGKVDTTTSGASFYNIGLQYHIGSNPAMKKLQFNQNFSVCCGKELPVTVTLDVAKIFNGAQTIDVVTERNSEMNNTAQEVIGYKFADNFSQALDIE